MEKQISIVVPIYNGEKYLKRCIDSIVNQSFGIDRIELFLLNDGSKDNSLTIAKEYAKKFLDSIKVFSHKNMGTAKTRNRGISLVKTKYMMFVDQDDFIDNDYCETFYKIAEKTNADIVLGGFRRTNAKEVFYIRRAKRTVWYPFIHAEAWAKIHRTDFVRKIKAEFFDNIFGEDILFSLKETFFSKKYETINYVGYNWFTNKNSITRTAHKDFSNLNLSKLLKEIVSLDQSQLMEYYTFIVALYAFMMSNILVGKKEFKKNLDETFNIFNKLVPNFSSNIYLKKRINGCPFKTYMAARIFESFYKKGWYNLLYFLNYVEHRRMAKK